MPRALLCCLLLAACRGPVTRMVEEPPPPPPPACGDGLIQEGEACDGSELGSGSCQSLGFDTGRLVCNACQYDTTLCVKRCGNGVLDLGESCDGALGVPPCTTWGFNACTDSCVVDTRRCVAQAFEAGPQMDIAKGGPAVLGDLAPRGPGDLVMAVPAFTRVEIVPWSMTLGFEASASKKLSFLRDPRRAELIDANGDGTTDVASINGDGSFDLMLATGLTYTLQPLDGGCPGATFLPSNGAPRATLEAVGCGAFFELSSSGVKRTDTDGGVAVARAPSGVWWADGTPAVHLPDGGAQGLPAAALSIAPGDLDGDGDEDLAALTAAGVELFENTGAGFAARATFTAAAPGELRVLDVDEDGRADLFFSSGEDLVVRRNQGGWTFTEVRVPAGSGARLSVALGDADGDGDLDCAVTVSSGGESASTRLFKNRLR